jgi:hypothetical protein
VPLFTQLKETSIEDVNGGAVENTKFAPDKE